MDLRAGAAATLGALAVGLSTACSSGSSGGSGPPACTAHGGTNGVPVIPASGTVTGSGVSASICSGGAFATLEHAQGSTTTTPYILFISTADMGNVATFNVVQKPAGAQEAILTVLAGVSTLSPGTYSSADGACGGAAFCVYFPPSMVSCAGGTATSCPPGCSLQGPVSAPTCGPKTQEVCYSSQAMPSCVYGTMTPKGSWTATLTSVEPYSGLAGHYVVHGSYTTSMISDDGTQTATMNLSF